MLQTWHDGTSVPNNSIGVNGDYYLQVDNGDIYNKYTNQWVRIGNMMGKKGEKGEAGVPGRDGLPGDDGINGSEWHDGVGAPFMYTGKVGDYFLDTQYGDVFKKINAENWERIGNLRGPQGEAGVNVQEGLISALEDRVEYLERNLSTITNLLSRMTATLDK